MGETYENLRTIFELNKRYGFTKFVIVVLTVAIKKAYKTRFKSSKTISGCYTTEHHTISFFTIARHLGRCGASRATRMFKSWWRPLELSTRRTLTTYTKIAKRCEVSDQKAQSLLLERLQFVWVLASASIRTKIS